MYLGVVVFIQKQAAFCSFSASLLSLETTRKLFVQLVLGSLASLKDVYALLSSILVANCKEYIIADVSAKNWIRIFFLIGKEYYDSTKYGQIHLPLTDGPSIKCVLHKTFFVFQQNLMKLGEVVRHIECYKIRKFYQILKKNKKVLCRTHLMDGPSIKGRWIQP